MNGEMILHFAYGQDNPETLTDEDDDHSWWADNLYGGARVGLCDSGLRQYVGVPEECEEFDAVFTVTKPLVDHFKIAKSAGGFVNLETEKGIGWYEFVIDFLTEAHDNGFRYLRVEFDDHG